MALQAVTTGEILYAVFAEELLALCTYGYRLACLMICLTGTAVFCGDRFAPSGDDRSKRHGVGLILYCEISFPKSVLPFFFLLQSAGQGLLRQSEVAKSEETGSLISPEARFAGLPTTKSAVVAVEVVASVAAEGRFSIVAGATCWSLLAGGTC